MGEFELPVDCVGRLFLMEGDDDVDQGAILLDRLALGGWGLFRGGAVVGFGEVVQADRFEAGSGDAFGAVADSGDGL
ncbi:hypothetical protein AB0I94_34325 [Streptomyces sp. NPDC050147]|uniref:hypothetical protein n=1 Tax=Streptomyces sp. NPDC050147 TaxID=3155513 RepID=UPI003442148C